MLGCISGQPLLGLGGDPVLTYLENGHNFIPSMEDFGAVIVEQRMVYSIYYMITLVLPCIGEGRRLLVRDGSGRRTRDVIHFRRMGIGIYTKYIT